MQRTMKLLKKPQTSVIKLKRISKRSKMRLKKNTRKSLPLKMKLSLSIRQLLMPKRKLTHARLMPMPNLRKLKVKQAILMT